MQARLRANILTSMILHRLKNLAYIAAGKSNKWIAWNCGHGLHVIRQIQRGPDADSSQIDLLHDAISALQGSSLTSWSGSMNFTWYRVVSC
jgi:hypothetical protein